MLKIKYVDKNTTTAWETTQLNKITINATFSSAIDSHNSTILSLPQVKIVFWSTFSK